MGAFGAGIATAGGAVISVAAMLTHFGPRSSPGGIGSAKHKGRYSVSFYFFNNIETNKIQKDS